MSEKIDKSFNPKVSIVIPVYNGENYLKEAIDSALYQTYKNIEIVVVNDGSIDKTEEIAKSYGNKIKYYKKQNGGTSTALNIGIKNMTGDYFSWLSHDDQYYPNKIKRQIEELSRLKDKDTIMMTDLDGINSDYEKIYVTNYYEHIKEYPKRANNFLYPIIYNKTHGCTLLFSKKCFEEVGLFDEKEFVAQDFEFFYRAFSKFPHKLISEVLVTARDSSNRQGRRLKSKGNVEYSRLYIKMIDQLKDEDYLELAPSKFCFYKDMEIFFKYAGYSYALEYIRNKMLKNLQVSSNDLIGNKFNGHNLHLYLREKGIDSFQMVLNKQSADDNTFEFDFNKINSTFDFIQTEKFVETSILHFHLIHNLIDINYLPLITKLKPTIISLHDAFFIGSHCVHHFECTNWKKHCKDCPHLDELFPLDYDKSALIFEMKKTAIQNSQIDVIVASNWMKKTVKDSPIWNNKKIHYVPFGIDFEIFKPENIKIAKKKLKIENNKFVIMFRSDASIFKGLNIIIKALKKLKNKEKYCIISVGEKGLLKELKNDYKIIDFGWIYDDRRMADLYQACDLFLMPSRFESFGMMAIEAMACAKTVLVLDTPGSALPETVNAPECGIAVKEERYAKELKRIITNKKELSIRNIKSLEYVRSKHSKEQYIDSISKVYKEVIKKHVKDEGVETVLQQIELYCIPFNERKNTVNFSQINSSCSNFDEKPNYCEETVSLSNNNSENCVVNQKTKKHKKNPILVLREEFRKRVSLEARIKLKHPIKNLRENFRKRIPLSTRTKLRHPIRNIREAYRKRIPIEFRKKLKKIIVKKKNN